MQFFLWVFNKVFLFIIIIIIIIIIVIIEKKRLSWIAVLLMGTYVRTTTDGVAQDGEHTPANRLAETYTLGL